MSIDSLGPGEEDTLCVIFKFTLLRPNQCCPEAETDFEGRNFLFGIDLEVLLALASLWLRYLICEQRSSYLPTNPRIWIMPSSLLTFYWCGKRHSKRAQGFNQRTWIHYSNLNSVGTGHHYCQTEISLPFLAVFQWALASLPKPN